MFVIYSRNLYIILKSRNLYLCHKFLTFFKPVDYMGKNIRNFFHASLCFYEGFKLLLDHPFGSQFYDTHHYPIEIVPQFGVPHINLEGTRTSVGIMLKVRIDNKDKISLT